MCPASNLLYQIPERSFVRMKAVSSPQKLAAFGGLFLFRLGTILALASGRFSEARKKAAESSGLSFPEVQEIRQGTAHRDRSQN
jgi:hypothetical protein